MKKYYYIVLTLIAGIGLFLFSIDFSEPKESVTPETFGSSDIVFDTITQVKDSIVQEQGDCIATQRRCTQMLKHMRGVKEVEVHEYGDPRIGYGYQVFIKDGVTTTSIGYGYEAESRTWIRVAPIKVASST